MMSESLRARTLAVVILLGGLVVFDLSSAGALEPQPPPVPQLPEVPGLTAGTGSGKTAPSSAGTALIGIFRLSKGVCGSGSPGAITSGSYFRMFDPSGGLVTNGSSPCGNQTYTPLSPGTDGGLATTGYQPNPSAAFDGAGNGLNGKVTQPQEFYGTRFSTATNAKDPQTGVSVDVPSIFNDGGALSGDLRAFAAAWQNQHFNQGSPKPDGSTPGETSGPSGTYNSSTKVFVIGWKSLIQGGPFNNFTGQWHFVGTFDPGAIPTSVKGASGGGSSTGGFLADTGSIPWAILGTALIGLAIIGLTVAKHPRVD